MRRKKILNDAQSFCVYYGMENEERLKPFDLVIVESGGVSSAAVSRLQQEGKLVMAYTSVMEIRKDDPFFSLLQDEDWLKANGRCLKNPAYGNRLVDLRSKRWNGLLHHRIGQLLTRGGYDGIFLDTIGNVEWPSLTSSIRELQLQAAAQLVKGLRSLFPGHLFIQNNGIERLYAHTSEWIDAVCWENPLFCEPHLEWSSRVAENLALLGRQGKRVLLLFEEGEHTER